MTGRHDCLWTRQGCNSGTEEDGERLPALTEKPDSLCLGCLKGIERSLGDAPETFVRLQSAIGDRSMRPSQRVTGTKNPPVPVNVDVAAASDRLVEWLVVGALRVADVMNMDESVEPESRITTEHARVVDRCCKILRPNIERLIESPEDVVTVWRKTGESTMFRDMSGPDIAAEIKAANRWGRKILRGNPEEIPCPLCETKTMFHIVPWTSGGKYFDIVECQKCRRRWEYSDYQTICRVALRAIKEEQERDMAENQELRARAELAEWLLAETRWRVSLAEGCTDISAAEFFKTIGEAA